MRRRTGNGTINPQWIYIMVCLPNIFLVKVGISGKVSRRASEVSEKVFGIAVPVFAVYIPFAFALEQFMHRLFSPANVRYGGGNEWFWLPVAPFAFALMTAAFLAWWSVMVAFVLFLSWLLAGCPPEPAEALAEWAKSIFTF